MVFSGDIPALQLPVAAFTLNCWCTLRTLQAHIPQPQILCVWAPSGAWQYPRWHSKVCHLEGITPHILCGLCMLLATTSPEPSSLAPMPANQPGLHAWVLPLHLETPSWVWNGPWPQNSCLNSQGSPARGVSWPIEDRLHTLPWKMVGYKKLGWMQGLHEKTPLWWNAEMQSQHTWPHHSSCCQYNLERISM